MKIFSELEQFQVMISSRVCLWKWLAKVEESLAINVQNIKLEYEVILKKGRMEKKFAMSQVQW